MKMVDAEIYATVGDEEKVNYLWWTLLDYHVTESSIQGPLPSLMYHEGQGWGVDVALNSFSGELLYAIWRCITVFGTMVEIGRRDMIGYGKLDIDAFLEEQYERRNVTSCRIVREDKLTNATGMNTTRDRYARCTCLRKQRTCFPCAISVT